MLLHRSININEFHQLLYGKIIKGQYNLKKENQNSFKKEGLYLSFYQDDYWWIDNNLHCICVIVDIPENKLEKGIGTYYASKNFAKTHIWSGRRGTEFYSVNECYTKKYSLKDVVAITLPDYTQEALKPYIEILKKNNITIFERPDIEIKENKLKSTLSFKFTQYTIDKKRSIHEALKQYFKNICMDKYTGTIDINCFDSSRHECYSTITPNCSVHCLLYNKEKKSAYIDIKFLYEKDILKQIEDNYKNNLICDFSQVKYSMNNFKKSYKGTMVDFEKKLEEIFKD